MTHDDAPWPIVKPVSISELLDRLERAETRLRALTLGIAVAGWAPRAEADPLLARVRTLESALRRMIFAIDHSPHGGWADLQDAVATARQVLAPGAGGSDA